ncbi:MAG: TolC family protein, partial [Candidatus Desantisbacteria bacterium]
MSIRYISLLLIFLSVESKATELSLNEAIKTALEGNKDLVGAGYCLEIASWTYKASSLLEFKPKASLETEAIHSEKKEQEVKESSTKYPSSANFEQKYPLFLGGQIKLISGIELCQEKGEWTVNPKVGFEWNQPISKSGIRAGNSSLISRGLDWQIADLGYEESVEKIIYDVTLAYYNLLKATKSRALAKSQIELTRHLLKVSQARLNVGQIPELDLMRVKLRLGQDEVRLIEAEKNEREAKRTLSNLLGLAQTEELRVSDNDPNLPKETPLLNTALKKALVFRLDLLKQELNIRLKEIELDKARSQDNPSLVVDGTYQLKGKDKELQGVIDEFPDKEWEAGLKIAFSLSDGGIKRANLQKAILELEKERLAYEELKRDIRDEIATIFDDLSSHQKALKVQEMSLDIA